MRTNRVPIVHAILLSFLFLLASCGKPEPTAVRIGVIAPFTGSGANYGEMASRGLEIALDEINKDRPSDRKIQLIKEDDQLNPQVGKTAFNKLVTVDKAVAVIGAFTSGVTMVLTPDAEQAKVPLISPTATNYKLKDAGDYFFRICPSDNFQGALLAKFAYNNLHARRVTILYMNTDYGFGLQKNFSEVFTSLGGTILGSEAFSQGATDFRGQLTKIRANNPDLVFAPSNYSEMASILRQARELRLRTKFLGGDGSFDPQLLTLAGKDAEGFILSTQALADTTHPVVSSFVKEFRKRYGEDPTPFASLWYDALHIVAIAVKQAEEDEANGGLTPENVKKALYKTKYAGVTGETKFDEFGEVEKPFALFEVKNGQFAPLIK